jgi:hypothetical protein
MKKVITQDDRNNSDLHPGIAVLGFEFRLPCYNIQAINRSVVGIFNCNNSDD